MIRIVGAVAGVVGLFGASVAVAEAGTHPLSEQCDLFRIGSLGDATTESCLKCHDGRLATAASSHPVNIDYAHAAARPRSGLRSADEVVRRGVFLPDGEVRCVTCHDGRSPWKYGIAIPPGAKVKIAPNPRDPSTFEGGPSQARREAQVLASSEQHSIAVGTKPLCILCHALD